MAYRYYKPHTAGWYNPLHKPNNHGFCSHCSSASETKLCFSCLKHEGGSVWLALGWLRTHWKLQIKFKASTIPSLMTTGTKSRPLWTWRKKTPGMSDMSEGNAECIETSTLFLKQVEQHGAQHRCGQSSQEWSWTGGYTHELCPAQKLSRTLNRKAKKMSRLHLSFPKLHEQHKICTICSVSQMKRNGMNVISIPRWSNILFNRFQDSTLSLNGCYVVLYVFSIWFQKIDDPPSILQMQLGIFPSFLPSLFMRVTLFSRLMAMYGGFLCFMST